MFFRRSKPDRQLRAGGGWAAIRYTLLVAKKVGASLQVDGLDVRAALEAAGAGDGLPDGLDAALSLGKAMYRVLARAA